jgi:[histone H4]-N-methyl-L-lysine20 N-methyltransferase
MAPSKAEKRGLTLEKLASYDDVITDALVDKVGYGTARMQQLLRPHSEFG